LLQPGIDAPLVPWSMIDQAIALDARRDARWIFHIGHVGSTLVARLLGELKGVLAVREPRLLRDLTFFPREVRDRFMPQVQALMSRTFADDEVALVKATSMVGEIAAELVPASERALLLFATPEHFIQSMLAGPNSVQELAALAEFRAARMADRVPGFPFGDSAAQRAAAAWACEMTALEAAAEAMPGRQLLWRDFDRMLDAMTSALADLSAFFGLQPSAGQIDVIVQGPLLRRYSKALEYDYSPNLRRDLLADAGKRHASEIAQALRMLDSAAVHSPLLARALNRACQES
jgi:hypothetical protein